MSSMQIDRLLDTVVRLGASDLHLTVGVPPMMRLHGDLNPLPGWAVLEWECCLKHPEDGAREGAPFIAEHIIRVAERAFDDFAATGVDAAANRRMLGIE